MKAHPDETEQVDHLLATPDLADALESQQFRRFLDQIPIAIVVAELNKGERIVYANPEFETLSGQSPADLEGKPWSFLQGQDCTDQARKLGEAIVAMHDRVGTFHVGRGNGKAAVVDVYSNLIEDDTGTAAFRLAAFVDVQTHADQQREELEERLQEKDTLLKELQHRVRNNLQMITALVRMEARNAPDGNVDAGLSRLAGRVEALKLLYQSLHDDGTSETIDLGVYLSQIASAVMRAHSVEGIRLQLEVDSYPVSVNVAMPAGLVVNELLTNSLKHAFDGRDGGTITVQSLTGENGCKVIVADDGVGLPDGIIWPRQGKLSALIVQSLRTNAKATIDFQSSPEHGTRATILFTRSAAAPA